MIFNPRLGILVPVAEIATTRGKGSGPIDDSSSAATSTSVRSIGVALPLLP
jgi:hypothetical protein